MRLTLATALLLLATPVLWDDDLRDFRSTDGGYRVRLPGKPAHKDLPTPEGLLHLAQVEVPGKGVFVVAWADLVPAAGKPPRPEDRLKQATHAIVKRLHGKDAKSRPITLQGGHPGRKVQANIPRPEGVVRARVYLVGGRLYEVMAVGARDWAMGTQAEEVLGSFALVR